MKRGVRFSHGVCHSRSVSVRTRARCRAISGIVVDCLCSALFFLASSAGRHKNACKQQSAEFEREGNSWRLELSPKGPAGEVELYLRLVSQDKPADYSVERCFRLRVLHPTDESLNRTQESNGRFLSAAAWSVTPLLQAEDVSSFSHQGFVALQATVWSPPQPAEEQDEVMVDAKPLCHICMAAPVSCLVRCCNAVKSCDACMQRQLNQQPAACPWCRVIITRSEVVFGVKL